MSALVIVDMLKDFIEPDGKLYVGKHVSEIITPIYKKLTETRNNDEVIIYLCDSHKENDLEFERFPPHCIEGTSGAEIIDKLAPNYDAYKEFVVPKTRYSGFYKTGLEDIVKNFKINQVEVVGVCTHICVMDTIADFTNRDIKTVVDTDAVADFDYEMYVAALSRMEKVYGTEIIRN